MPMLQNPRASRWREAVTMEGVGKTRASWMGVLRMGERREERTPAFCTQFIYHCRKSQTDSDSTTSTVICHRPLTAGSSHKPVVIWTFTAGSWPPQSFSDFEAQNRHWSGLSVLLKKKRNLRCFSLPRDSKNLSDSAWSTNNNARRLGNLLKEESLELGSKLILPEIIKLLNNFWFSGILLRLGNITDSDSNSDDDIKSWKMA